MYVKECWKSSGISCYLFSTLRPQTFSLKCHWSVWAFAQVSDFFVVQHRIQVWCSQQAHQGSLCPSPKLASTWHPSPFHSFPPGQDLPIRTVGLSRSQRGAPWADLTALPQSVYGLLWNRPREKCHYPDGKRTLTDPWFQLSQRQMKIDIRPTLFLSSRTKYHVHL